MTIVGMHDKVIHSDELVAAALISLVDDIEVVRSRDSIVLGECDILVDVGEVYDPERGMYDHHQFDLLDSNYGLSSAGLVWDDLRESIINNYKGYEEDISEFISAVDARDTRVAYDPSNKYNHILDAVSSYNNIDPTDDNEQAARFYILLELMKSLLLALLAKDITEFTEIVEFLEKLSRVANAQNELIFMKRQEDMKSLGTVLVAKYFPAWRSVARYANRQIIMPGDNPGEYKIMCDTSHNRIVGAKDAIFIHRNGFIAIVKPMNDIISFVTSDSDIMQTVSVKDIEVIFEGE